MAIKRYNRDGGFLNTGEVRGRRWMEVLMYSSKAIVCIYVGYVGSWELSIEPLIEDE